MSGLLFVFASQTQNERILRNKNDNLNIWTNLSCFFLPWRQFRFPLWRLSFGFGVITVYAQVSLLVIKLLIKCRSSDTRFSELLLADLQSILVLVNREEWNEFRCCPFCTYIFCHYKLTHKFERPKLRYEMSSAYLNETRLQPNYGHF